MAPSTAPIVRSSLEEMLESLQRRDEKPNDLPPALPLRPASKARLPSSRKSLPVNFRIGHENDEVNGFGDKDEDEVLRRSRGSFGRKKTRVEQPGESPYAGVGVEKRRDGLRVDRTVSDPQGIASAVSATRAREPEWEDDIGYFIKKKLTVWCRLSTGSWALGRIQSTSGDKVLLLLSDGRVTKVPTGELYPANPDLLDDVDDLIQLYFLNEPSVLHSLQSRYSKDLIYSEAGPLLIAINPFKDPQVIDEDSITAYRHKLLDSPHVYGIVDRAYCKMMRDGLDQSIIISGDSGAGKTETAKMAIRYLTSLSTTGSDLEIKIVQSSCIMEAFGNAKTSRNNNATRFGSLTELHFTSTGNICRARFHTFFLEKSRVAQLSGCESSFHIFFQLCAGASSNLKDRLNLREASFYKYLNQSDLSTIHSVDDEQKFHSLLEALDAVKICKEDQEHVFEMVATVLWLGNLSYTDGHDNGVEVVADEALSTVSRLLGCNTQDLVAAISVHRTQADKRLTLEQVTASRDALASNIYTGLFDWLVQEINKSLEGSERKTGNKICILDMFGFEASQKNTFEQLCINYANERLQQHYIRHLLKLEQEECEMDGIDWNKVDFQDNQDCLRLFEKSPKGLFSLLDEESRSFITSDMTFYNRLKQHFSGNSCYKSEQGGHFIVRHYVGEVKYDTAGFLVKNRNLLYYESAQFLSSCSSHLAPLISCSLLKQTDSENLSLSDTSNISVGTLFKGQIFKLIQQLESSTPHFILCIQPNNKQLPNMFEKEIVLNQLRSHGIFEVVRIARCGYHTRITHQEFASRYGILLGDSDNVSQDPLSISTAIIQQYNIPPSSFQVGYTKLFFRTGQIDQLEMIRTQVLEGAFEVKQLSRTCRTGQDFEKIKIGVTALQSFIRGEKARRKYSVLRKLSGKEQFSSRTLQRDEETIIQLQSAIRGWLARQKFSHMRNAKGLGPEMAISAKTFGARTSLKDMFLECAVVSPSKMKEIRVQLVKAEATISQKEEENITLRQQLRQLQSKWSGHEAKMKIMEEAWQRQMASLQTSLAAAKNGVAASTPAVEPRRFMVSPSPLSDSEDTVSVGYQTGASSPMPYFGSHPEPQSGQEANGNAAPISYLASEFDQKKQYFDDEVKSLTDKKSGPSGLHHNPEQQLRQLKLRFAQWKKDYKMRLRETKAKLRKQGHTDMERSRRKWWGKKHRKTPT